MVAVVAAVCVDEVVLAVALGSFAAATTPAAPARMFLSDIIVTISSCERNDVGDEAGDKPPSSQSSAESPPQSPIIGCNGWPVSILVGEFVDFLA